MRAGLHSLNPDLAILSAKWLLPEGYARPWIMLTRYTVATLLLLCVGTPSRSDGSTRLDYLRQVFGSIAKQLHKKDEYFVVALRSTVLPPVFEEELIPLLQQHSGKSAGTHVGFVYNPEFLREGMALKDFQDAPWTIIGSWDSRAADVVASLYQNLTAPIIRTDPKTAALVKYFSNTFHALKVVFG